MVLRGKSRRNFFRFMTRPKIGRCDCRQPARACRSSRRRELCCGELARRRVPNPVGTCMFENFVMRAKDCTMRDIAHIIAGKTVTGANRTPVFNPATGEESAQVASGGAAEIDAAVTAARAAFPAWAATPPAKRAKTMYEMRRLLEARKEELARAISAEHGKTHADALGEVARGQEVVEFACGIAHLLKGSFSAQVATGIDTHDIRQPLGVVAGITPFNF